MPQGPSAAGVLLRLSLLLLLVWSVGFLWFVFVPPQAAPATKESDGIVVLTGDAGRIGQGVALLKAGTARRMLISGVPPGVSKRAIAEKNRVPLGVLECCVDIGSSSIDTRSNAEETAAWVGINRYRSIRLVTSDYHYRRALLELRAELDPSVEVLPEPVRSEKRSWQLMLWEYNKYLFRLAVREGGSL